MGSVTVLGMLSDSSPRTATITSGGLGLWQDPAEGGGQAGLRSPCPARLVSTECSQDARSPLQGLSRHSCGPAQGQPHV